MKPSRLKNGIAIALVLGLCSVRALAQDDSGIETPDDWPTPGSSNIAEKYKATLEKPPNVEWSLGAELGFLAVASHIVQLGNDGTRFNYREDGGQDVLFPFFRLSTDLKFKGRHTVVFLYQPLKLTGETVLRQDTTFDDTVFPSETPLNSTYGFPWNREQSDPPSDGYTKNWLHFITVSLGVELRAVQR
ncbi:MAG: hypothetical protein OER77_03145 [Myxococcales bacterium]|nr:hypothetical protein [Myxococcales bacterium]